MYKFDVYYTAITHTSNFLFRSLLFYNVTLLHMYTCIHLAVDVIEIHLEIDDGDMKQISKTFRLLRVFAIYLAC